jgi:hypothetical protein
MKIPVHSIAGRHNNRVLMHRHTHYQHSPEYLSREKHEIRAPEKFSNCFS